MRIKTIKDINLKRMRVFLRADMNVPLENRTQASPLATPGLGAILDDFRIRATLPTIDYIIKNGGKVILATHMGQPNAEKKTNFFDENLSTKILATWLKNHGYEVDYEVDLLLAQKKSYQHPKHILLLENLRFFNGEKALDIEFAELLADLGDVYINDAFGLIHRPDTSITILPEQFIESNRAAGLLIEQEITHLNKLKQTPEQPFIIVLGGNKIDTKIDLLNAYLEAEHMPS
ncbi:MAG: phosphoglycerate kinase, partial [bacterium]